MPRRWHCFAFDPAPSPLRRAKAAMQHSKPTRTTTAPRAPITPNHHTQSSSTQSPPQDLHVQLPAVLPVVAHPPAGARDPLREPALRVLRVRCCVSCDDAVFFHDDALQVVFSTGGRFCWSAASAACCCVRGRLRVGRAAGRQATLCAEMMCIPWTARGAANDPQWHLTRFPARTRTCPQPPRPAQDGRPGRRAARHPRGRQRPAVCVGRRRGGPDLDAAPSAEQPAAERERGERERRVPEGARGLHAVRAEGGRGIHDPRFSSVPTLWFHLGFSLMAPARAPW